MVKDLWLDVLSALNHFAMGCDISEMMKAEDQSYQVTAMSNSPDTPP